MVVAYRIRRSLLCLLFLSLTLGFPAAVHALTLLSNSKSETDVKGESQGPMTREELQFAITAFTDSFGARMFEATTELENQAMTSGARLAASRMKYASLASAIEIACGPHPGPAGAGPSGSRGSDNAHPNGLGGVLASAGLWTTGRRDGHCVEKP